MTLSAAYWAADRSHAVLGLTAGDALRGAAAEAPDATALVEGAVDPAARRRWSYAGLLEASERAARALLGRFTPGDRVAVWANNIPEWVIPELAAGLAGITIVTVNPALRPQELAYTLGQSQADGIFLGLTSRYEPGAPTPLSRPHRPHDHGRQAARPPDCAVGQPGSAARCPPEGP